jgi:hypothetical protein
MAYITAALHTYMGEYMGVDTDEWEDNPIYRVYNTLPLDTPMHQDVCLRYIAHRLGYTGFENTPTLEASYWDGDTTITWDMYFCQISHPVLRRALYEKIITFTSKPLLTRHKVVICDATHQDPDHFWVEGISDITNRSDVIEVLLNYVESKYDS